MPRLSIHIWLSALALGLIVSCDESTSHRLARERELQLKEAQAAAAEPKTALERALASLEVGQRLVLYCAADLRDPTQSTQLAILQDTVPALGNGLVLKHLDAGGDAGVQLTQLQQVQKAKPAILLAHPIEGRLTSAILHDMSANGTVVLGMDASVEADSGAVTSFVDDKKAGALAAEHTISALKRKSAAESNGASQTSGRVIQITADEDSMLTKSISSGFADALKSEPGIILVHEAPAFWTKEGAKARVTEALRLQGQFDVVVAHTDEIALGVSEALSLAGKREEVLIIAIGGLKGPDGGVELLRNSIVDAVIYRPLPMEKLYEELSALAKDPNHRPKASRAELQPVLLTPKNLEDALQGR